MKVQLDAKAARRQLDELGISGKASDINVDLWKLATLVHDLQQRIDALERPAQTIGRRILDKLGVA